MTAARAAFGVVEPGLLTTIQDLGRPGAVASGVPPGGAMDRFAHRAANLLVGNPPQDATLECTLTGPTLEALTPCVVAITGGDLDARIDGVSVPTWTAHVVERGARLSFGTRRSGARAYVALAGGFDGDRWLGSRSTNLMAMRGGMNGRALSAGDELGAATERDVSALAGRSSASSLPPDYGERLLHAMPGPHFRRLDQASRALLFSSDFTAGHDSGRMSVRLDGPPLTAGGEELLPFALVAGAIQLPTSGGPILLMADHETAGAHPVVAAVVSSSMPVAAQLVPGDTVRLMQVTAAQANARRLALNQSLASLAAP